MAAVQFPRLYSMDQHCFGIYFLLCHSNFVSNRGHFEQLHQASKRSFQNQMLLSILQSLKNLHNLGLLLLSNFYSLATSQWMHIQDKLLFFLQSNSFTRTRLHMPFFSLKSSWLARDLAKVFGLPRGNELLIPPYMV